MSKGDSGLFHGTSGKRFGLTQLRASTRKAVNQLIENTPGSKRKSMAVGAYDKNTGKIVAAFAGEIPKHIAPELMERASLIGGIGSHGVTERNTVGVCAEFHVVNSLLLSGSKWKDIRITPAIRPRTGKEMPFCDNCKIMFHDIIDK